ncbi:hypothetical protein ACFV8Z_08380 [Streptomyces sp. NPDC059837]|uniref:hypothetical protein n=1 Tax=Streptomyces sp. NPDC059837 TaxID=3346968 RepID=UPI0036678938
MNIAPGSPPDPADLATARHRYETVQQALPRVREKALAWRNGVGALLAGLIGFGLIKGRSDIGELASPYDAFVGWVLLAALTAGTVAALLLLRAAHGRPVAVDLRDLRTGHGSGSPASADHIETHMAARALSWGLALALTCTALLVTAVGMTWYGPDKKKPAIEVVTPTGVRCGSVVRMEAGRLTLKTAMGEVIVNLERADGIRAVASCTPKKCRMRCPGRAPVPALPTDVGEVE